MIKYYQDSERFKCLRTQCFSIFFYNTIRFLYPETVIYLFCSLSFYRSVMHFKMHLWTDISSECSLILLKQMIDKKKCKCK